MTETTSDNGKTIGIIAYLTIIGWIIALVMHNGNKTEHGAFHIRQMLGLIILQVIVYLINMFVGIYILGVVLGLILLVLWVLGFIGAIQGEKKLIPVLGPMFQDWFKGIG